MNVSHIESRPTNKTDGTFKFFVDYETPSGAVWWKGYVPRVLTSLRLTVPFKTLLPPLVIVAAVPFPPRLDENAQEALLEKLDGVARSVSVLANKEVPWFPRHASDLDKIADKVPAFSIPPPSFSSFLILPPLP